MCDIVGRKGCDTVNIRRRQLVVPLVTTVGAAVTAVLYFTTMEYTEWLTVVKLLGMAAVPFLLPLWGVLTRRPFPVELNVFIAVHVVLAGYGGSILAWYDTIPHWDLWMHALFGTVAAALYETLLRRWNGDGLHPVGFHTTVCLGVMGGAALWEIFEFVCDTLLGTDGQRVALALKLGTSPIADTMTDILITAVGIAVFYVYKGIKRAAHR